MHGASVSKNEMTACTVEAASSALEHHLVNNVNFFPLMLSFLLFKMVACSYGLYFLIWLEHIKVLMKFSNNSHEPLQPLVIVVHIQCLKISLKILLFSNGYINFTYVH